VLTLILTSLRRDLFIAEGLPVVAKTKVCAGKRNPTSDTAFALQDSSFLGIDPCGSFHACLELINIVHSHPMPLPGQLHTLHTQQGTVAHNAMGSIQDARQPALAFQLHFQFQSSLS
jgi:hypothetical protein